MFGVIDLENTVICFSLYFQGQQLYFIPIFDNHWLCISDFFDWISILGDVFDKEKTFWRYQKTGSFASLRRLSPTD